jgi:hypothetical protein
MAGVGALGAREVGLPESGARFGEDDADAVVEAVCGMSTGACTGRLKRKNAPTRIMMAATRPMAALLFIGVVYRVSYV